MRIWTRLPDAAHHSNAHPKPASESNADPDPQPCVKEPIAVPTNLSVLNTRSQCFGSVIFLHGKVRILGSTHWLTDPDPDPDPALLVSVFQDANKKVICFPQTFLLTVSIFTVHQSLKITRQ